NVLAALDDNTRLSMLTPQILIVYSTRPDAGNRPWDQPQSIRAFFIDTLTGALIRQQSWRTRPRLSPFDQGDSEGRIFPVKGGRYIVSAQNVLSLHSPDGVLLRTYQLHDTGVPVRVTTDGDHVVWRAVAADDRVMYLWLS